MGPEDPALEGEEAAAEINATEAAEGITKLYVKMKIKQSIEKKFQMNKARRQAPTFGTLTTLGGVVASCVLLAVAAGGYAFGVHRQRKAMTNNNEEELLEM